MIPTAWFPPVDALADHDTEELNVPVPWTLAANWSVCPGSTLILPELIVTDVIVGDGGGVLVPPPPHAARATQARSGSVCFLKSGNRQRVWAESKDIHPVRVAKVTN
jgi:hypothetical protein